MVDGIKVQKVKDNFASNAGKTRINVLGESKLEAEELVILTFQKQCKGLIQCNHENLNESNKSHLGDERGEMLT